MTWDIDTDPKFGDSHTKTQIYLDKLAYLSKLFFFFFAMESHSDPTDSFITYTLLIFVYSVSIKVSLVNKNSHIELGMVAQA